MFNPKDTSEKNIELALKLHMQYACNISDVALVEQVMNQENPYKAELIKEHQKIQQFLIEYFKHRDSSSSQAVLTGKELLQRRKLNLNMLDVSGQEIKQEMVHIGIDYIHEHFNNGALFPIGTFFSLVAGSGIGKSDYLYRIADSFLMQNYKTLIVSLEFGEQRLSTLLDSRENGGKDRMPKSRQADKFDNLFINFKARTLEELSLLIDVAHTNGIRAVLIDSFGEMQRDGEGEYILQQKTSIALNSKANDYNMFIMLIAQTKSSEQDGEYTVRGGTDLFYKPDLSIHIKKVTAEDISGDRIVHLFKNRDADINGKTIVTKYDFEKREPTYKCDYIGADKDGKVFKSLKLPAKKS